MPRPHKRDILGEKWEYTLLADDFSEIDDEAKNLNPSAGTMSWRGYSYPDIAYKFKPVLAPDGSSGPWWIPDEFLWSQGDLTLSILNKAFLLESVPVIKDTMLMNNPNIEIVRQEVVFIPKIKKTNCESSMKNQMRHMMRELVTCPIDKKELCFSELVNALKILQNQAEESFRIKLCLVKFSHRIWIEGISHIRIHPVIVISTNVFERYHNPVNI